MPRMLLPLLFLLTLTPAALAQAKTEPPAPPSTDGSGVYKSVLRSTVWVRSDRGNGKLATGSGTLVDKGRRLILTNYHVVGDVKKATVYFPEFGKDKKAISERTYYLNRSDKLGIPGEVIEIDKEGDLALIRIDRVPDGVPELPLAASSPEPGQAVHSIGNPGKSGALWVYTPGKVRQVYTKKWQAKLDARTTLHFQAKVIETDSPTNPGDSGGPLVNDKGELVGVTQGAAVDAQALSLFVDLSEVKRLLNRRSVQSLRSTTEAAAPAQKEKEPAKPRRDSAITSKDDAKLFTQETMKKVQAAADKLFKEKDIDLFVETIDALPKGDLEKVKAMKKEDRDKYFKERALERCKAEKVSGVYVWVCKNPSILWVEMVGPAAGKFPAGTGSRFLQMLLTAFKDKKFDSGLLDGVNFLLDLQGLAEKKNDKKEEKK